MMVILVETQRLMMDICEINPTDESRLARPLSSEARAAMDAQERGLEKAIQLK